MSYRNVKLAPSILAADFTKLGQEVKAAEAAGADYIHIDVMDGRFVPNITMGQLVVKALRPLTELTLDVHLMIVEPERYIESFADAGADIISVHVEASPHLHRTLGQIHAAGCKAGVALNPHTPAKSLQEVITMIDLVNVMTVNPGFGGQSFIENMTSKIAELGAMIGNVQRQIDIEVDGGINEQTASMAVQAGANILVIGSAAFKHPEGVEAGLTAIQTTLQDELS